MSAKLARIRDWFISHRHGNKAARQEARDVLREELNELADAGRAERDWTADEELRRALACTPDFPCERCRALDETGQPT